MEEFALELMQTNAVFLVYVMLFLGSGIEYIFPPFPGDTVLLFGAFLSGLGDIPLIWTFTAATAGSFLGSMGIYAFGVTKGRKYFLKKNLRFFDAARVQSLENIYRRRGGAIIIVNRFIPAFRTFFFIAAGIAKMPPVRVAVYSFISILLWNLLIAGLGYRAGSDWDVLKGYLDTYSRAVLAGLAVLTLGYVVYRLIRRKRDAKKSENTVNSDTEQERSRS
ncbi:MAG: DedA family protein [Deltaproteobacteria bacterium]|nr:DedA family protein [Candidatus Zymogenaceae bacterium]